MTLTREDVANALPANLKSAATDSLTDLINTIATDQQAAEYIRDNFVSYTSVLKEGKFKAEDYVRAVTFVSFRLMGNSNKEAYIKTFPERYQRLLANQVTDKDLSSYVAAYSRGRLVNLIMEQTLVPVHVLNQDLHQKAINQLANLMISASSEKVQVEAAVGLINATKKPETKAGIAINIDQRDSSGLNELKDSLARLAQKQIELIESGTPTALIAASPLIEGEAVEVQ